MTSDGTHPLGDLVELQRGATYKSALLDHDGPVLLGLSSIAANGGFRRDALRCYGGDSPRSMIVRPGEIYVSLKDVTQSGDLLGAVARVPSDIEAGRLTQDTVKLVFRDEFAGQSDYVYWLLRSPQYRQYCRTHAIGVTTLALPRDDFLAFPVPPLSPSRAALVRALGALNDKIEHNRAMSVRLTKAASADFERRSRDWADTGRGGVLDQLGGPVADRVADSGLPYIGLDAMPQGIPVLSEWTTDGAPNGQSSRFVQGDILFGKLRPYFKKVGIAPIDGRCSTEILVLRPHDDRNWGPLLGYALSDEFIAHCVANSTGTKMPRSEWRNIKDFPVTLPSPRDAARCTEFMGWTFDLVNAFIHESHSLAAIRDVLLTKLVSGRIRMPESYDGDDTHGTVVDLATAS
jgi:type I restriction enzyme S subunit